MTPAELPSPTAPSPDKRETPEPDFLYIFGAVAAAGLSAVVAGGPVAVLLARLYRHTLMPLLAGAQPRNSFAGELASKTDFREWGLIAIFSLWGIIPGAIVAYPLLIWLRTIRPIWMIVLSCLTGAALGTVLVFIVSKHRLSSSSLVSGMLLGMSYALVFGSVIAIVRGRGWPGRFCVIDNTISEDKQ